MVQDGELGALGIVEHLVVVGRIQREPLAQADAGLAVQHFDAVEAGLVKPLDLAQQFVGVRHLIAIVMEGGKRLAAAIFLQLHQGAQQILHQGVWVADNRAGHEGPVGVPTPVHHGDALVNVLGVKQVDVNIVDGISVQHKYRPSFCVFFSP